MALFDGPLSEGDEDSELMLSFDDLKKSYHETTQILLSIYFSSFDEYKEREKEASDEKAHAFAAFMLEKVCAF